MRTARVWTCVRDYRLILKSSENRPRRRELGDLGTINTLLIIEESVARVCLTRGDGGWTGERKGRREEARQGTKDGKEGANEVGRRKEERVGPSFLY